MEEAPVPKYTVRYTGLFDFDALYAAIIDWAKNYGYLWHEIYYKHKVPTPLGAEQQFQWELTKKVTEYIHYKIRMTVHIWDMLEMDVETNGRKKSLTSGRMYIIIEGKLGLDWANQFGGSRFAQKLGKWYAGFVYKKEIESVYWDQLHYRVINLQTMIKKYFDMQTKTHVFKHYLGEH